MILIAIAIVEINCAIRDTRRSGSNDEVQCAGMVNTESNRSDEMNGVNEWWMMEGNTNPSRQNNPATPIARRRESRALPLTTYSPLIPEPAVGDPSPFYLFDC